MSQYNVFRVSLKTLSKRLVLKKRRVLFLLVASATIRRLNSEDLLSYTIQEARVKKMKLYLTTEYPEWQWPLSLPYMAS